MRPGGRIVVVEIVVPEGNDPSFAKWMDLMMITYGGKERSEKQYCQLFSDAGYELTRIVPTRAVSASSKACLLPDAVLLRRPQISQSRIRSASSSSEIRKSVRAARQNSKIHWLLGNFPGGAERAHARFRKVVTGRRICRLASVLHFRSPSGRRAGGNCVPIRGGAL
jgi:hypothetical protein